MLTITSLQDKHLIDTLRTGGVAVVRTDTLYGVVALASNAKAVARVHALKNRPAEKSCIILLPSIDDAYDHQDILAHDVRITDPWRPTSFIIAGDGAPAWVRHTDGTVAYRIPRDSDIHQLIVRTGPLVAPSANPEGMPPAATIAQAIDYFGDGVDIYVDGGEVPADVQPSRLLHVHEDGRVEKLR